MNAEITRKIGIDMGHRVTNHKSKCKNFHGHRYRIELTVRGKVIETQGSSDEGMVADFGDIKTIMMDVIDKRFDHGFVLYNRDPLVEDFKNLCKKEDLKLVLVKFIPTVENIAMYWFGLLTEAFKNHSEFPQWDLLPHNLRVYETPNCWTDCNIHDYHTEQKKNNG